MAAQSGVLFFDGRPTESERDVLAAGLEPMAPDGVQTIVQAGMVMVFGACHVWTGEERCRQPLQTDAGLVMTWDGRLDNRDDLQLRLGGRLDGTVADASIALAVFERWGIEGLRSLVGDWSLAIWDGRTRTLHLARDYMGVRPLYYDVGNGAVMWSTSLGELAIRSGRVDDLNEEFVARFMTLQFSTEVTPYVGIRAVPTATCVSFSPEGVESRRRFWSLEPGHIRYRDSRQYEEHLRALWVDAVGSRLRTNGTVWAELSGGLDSSSAVCMADALIRDRRVPAADLRPVSHVTLDSAEGDERPFIAEVEAKTGRDSALFGLEMHDGERGEWDWETPLASKDVDVAIIRNLRQHRGRLILTGRVGDVVMGCFPNHSAAVLDDVAGGHFIAALAKARLWSRARRVPIFEVAADVGTVAVQARRGPKLAPSAAQRSGQLLLSQRLQRLITTVPRDLPAPGVRGSTLSIVTGLLRYSSQALLGVPAPPADIVYTHPFAHRPLVDFVCAIPAEQISAPGITRALMRRALSGLVPARVLTRHSKGYYPPAMSRLIRDRVGSMPPIESWQIVRNGWFAIESLHAAVRNLRDGGGPTASQIRAAVLVEQWLRDRERRGPAAIPQRKEVTTNAVLNA